MSQPLSFAGRVAIITGAGGALGRAYALLLASRGASVLVNDLGVPMAGAGESRGPADAVVAEIVAAGGKAVANFDNVLEGEKIVAAAIAAFGRVDIVINNAGILRDVSFAKMTQEQWSLIHKVHLDGAFKVTKAAWPYLLGQKYGRIIMTSSAAGLYGNHGQANYSSAKLALVGLSNTLAKEGQKNNVFCNVIAPIAGSRMTETVMPADLVAALDPKYVAPVVAFLCHESSTANGHIYESGAGYCAQVHWQRSAGVHFPLSGAGALSPEAIAAKMEQVSDFSSGATYPQGLNDTMAVIMASLGTGATTTLGSGKPSVAKPASQLKAQGANGSSPAPAAVVYKSDEIFATLKSSVESDPSIANKVNAILAYNISNGKQSKTWTVSLKKGAGAVYEGAPKDGKKADVTVDVADGDYCDLASGKASGSGLYMKGRLKMKGNLATAMKFDQVWQAHKKLQAKL